MSSACLYCRILFKQSKKRTICLAQLKKLLIITALTILSWSRSLQLWYWSDHFPKRVLKPIGTTMNSFRKYGLESGTNSAIRTSCKAWMTSISGQLSKYKLTISQWCIRTILFFKRKESIVFWNLNKATFKFRCSVL